MNRTWILAIATAGLIAPAAAQAQESTPTQPATLALTTARRAGVDQAAGGGGRGMAVETRITTGRPYSAEATTEAVQVLSDGNRINRRSTTRVYRDGEGRTRRETLADDGSVRTVAISDPVAHTTLTLDPKTKVAYKSGGNVISAVRMPSGTYTVTTPTGTHAVQTTEPAIAQGGGGRGGGGGVMMRTPAPDNPNVKKEELAPQNIEGVMASGTRTTTTIPAGEIGNAQEIRIVSEQWFSDELQVLVMTKHSDPRSGENTYRLRNILRAEPDQTLFTVPSDYTVQQRGIRQ